MKNIIKLCAGLSILGLTACSTTEYSEPARETLVQEEVIMMHPESAVRPEHHKKHHKKHHRKHPHAATPHKDAVQHHPPALHKNKAVQEQSQMQYRPTPAQGAAESK